MASGNPEAGWIYILTNLSMPGLVKIGMTKRDPMTRAAELSRASGVPTPFQIAHSRAVSDCRAVERVIHQRLGRYRIGQNREFFQMSIDEARQTVDEVAKGYGEGIAGGCIGVITGLFKIFLFFVLWPIAIPISLWQWGPLGKVGAGAFVLLLLAAVVLSRDEESPAGTAMVATATPVMVQVAVTEAATVIASDMDTTPEPETDAVMLAMAAGVAEMPTETATVMPTDTPMPTATPTTRPTATPTAVVSSAVVNRDANLRSGPGTEFAIVGSAVAGDILTVVGRNEVGDWYTLDDGNWVAAFLVEDAPSDVPLAAVIPTVSTSSVPAPPPETPAPAQVSVSQREQWDSLLRVMLMQVGVYEGINELAGQVHSGEMDGLETFAALLALGIFINPIDEALQYPFSGAVAGYAERARHQHEVMTSTVRRLIDREISAMDVPVVMGSISPMKLLEEYALAMVSVGGFSPEEAISIMEELISSFEDWSVGLEEPAGQ